MSQQEFVNGLIVKPKRDKAPDFIKCHISIKRQELIDWLQGKDGDWINIDIKKSAQGKLYASVDNFKPEPQGGGTDQGGGFDDDIPF